MLETLWKRRQNLVYIADSRLKSEPRISTWWIMRPEQDPDVRADLTHCSLQELCEVTTDGEDLFTFRKSDNKRYDMITVIHMIQANVVANNLFDDVNPVSTVLNTGSLDSLQLKSKTADPTSRRKHLVLLTHADKRWNVSTSSRRLTSLQENLQDHSLKYSGATDLDSPAR